MLGLAQGLAVYQNGACINEPLGDTVNWDLLPQSAIERITLSGGANPLFGLNSLGGSLVVSMDGFSYQGSEVEFSSGAFGRRTTSLETGNNDGSLAYYAKIDYFEEDDLEELGLDYDDVCAGQFADMDALEDFLNITAAQFDEDEFNLDDFADDLSLRRTTGIERQPRLFSSQSFCGRNLAGTFGA